MKIKQENMYKKKTLNEDINEVLKEVLRTNIKDTCDLRNKIRILENQLSNAENTIKNLQKSWDGENYSKLVQPTSKNQRKSFCQNNIYN